MTLTYFYKMTHNNSDIYVQWYCILYFLIPPFSKGFANISTLPSKSTLNILLMLFLDIRVTSMMSPGLFKHPVTAALDATSLRRRPRKLHPALELLPYGLYSVNSNSSWTPFENVTWTEGGWFKLLEEVTSNFKRSLSKITYTESM